MKTMFKKLAAFVKSSGRQDVAIFVVLVLFFFSLVFCKVYADQSSQPFILNFSTDSTTISKKSQEILDEVASLIQSGLARHFILVGHADERGSSVYNLALGDKRARSVYHSLVKASIDPSQIVILSKGESEPVDPRHHSRAWAKNRRVEIIMQ